MECSLKHQSALLVTKNGVVEKLMVLILTVITIYSLLKFFSLLCPTFQGYTSAGSPSRSLASNIQQGSVQNPIVG